MDDSISKVVFTSPTANDKVPSSSPTFAREPVGKNRCLRRWVGWIGRSGGAFKPFAGSFSMVTSDADRGVGVGRAFDITMSLDIGMGAVC